MNTQYGIEGDAKLRGQTQIWRYMYGIIDSRVIRCCVELRIADIINHHGRPTTISEIATAIDSPSINMDGLERLMIFLVRRKVFDEMSEKETVYSLNYCSKWLLCDTNMTLAPLVMMRTNLLMVSPLHVLSRSIKEGGSAFKMTHGEEFFLFLFANSQLDF